MSGTKFAIGVDFGTESGRAALVDISNGEVVATSVHPYHNGVIDARNGCALTPGLGLAGPQ